MNDEWCDNCGGGMKLRYIHQHKEFRRKPKSKLTVNQFQQQESNATLIVQKQDLNRVEGCRRMLLEVMDSGGSR